MKRLFLVLIILAVFIGCKTIPPENTPPPAVVITWPNFPDPAGLVVWQEDETVKMPAEYWLRIVGYAIDVDKVRDLVEAGE